MAKEAAPAGNPSCLFLGWTPCWLAEPQCPCRFSYYSIVRVDIRNPRLRGEDILYDTPGNRLLIIIVEGMYLGS